MKFYEIHRIDDDEIIEYKYICQSNYKFLWLIILIIKLLKFNNLIY